MMHISAVFKFCFRLCVISGLRRKVDENCTLLGHYAASSGNLLRTFRDNLSGAKNVLFVFGFLIFENGTDILFRNIGKELSIFAA
jgi:hypothetical protein